MTTRTDPFDNPAPDDGIGRRLDLAIRLAHAAGATASAYFARRADLRIERKAAAQDMVSEADRAVETEIRAAVSREFPEDSLVGEEHEAVSGRSGHAWVIDPIDGTSPFLTGQPTWCISIAVTGPAGVEAGVIHAPVLGETYAVRRGAGAFLNGRRMRLDPAATVDSGNVAYGGTHTADPREAGAFVEALYRDGGVVFRVGSGALMLAYVADGRLAGYFDPSINAWDCFAGNLMVEEAGGMVRYDGGIGRSGPLWAGAPAVIAAMLRYSGRG